VLSRLNIEKVPTASHFDHPYGKRHCVINYESNRVKEPTINKAGPSCDNDYTLEVTTNTINDSQTTVGDNDSTQEVTTNAINESQTVVELKRKVKHLQRLLRLEKKKVVQFERNLNRFLNDDQVRHLKLNSASARAMKWSNDTIKSSLKIRCATGAKGYTYLRNEGYPLPSYRTLCNRVENAQFQPGIHHDVMGWLKVKVDSLPSMGKDCILAIDEMQLQPTVQYDKGNI